MVICNLGLGDHTADFGAQAAAALAISNGLPSAAGAAIAASMTSDPMVSNLFAMKAWQSAQQQAKANSDAEDKNKKADKASKAADPQVKVDVSTTKQLQNDSQKLLEKSLQSMNELSLLPQLISTNPGNSSKTGLPDITDLLTSIAKKNAADIRELVEQARVNNPLLKQAGQKASQTPKQAPTIAERVHTLDAAQIASTPSHPK